MLSLLIYCALNLETLALTVSQNETKTRGVYNTFFYNWHTQCANKPSVNTMVAWFTTL